MNSELGEVRSADDGDDVDELADDELAETVVLPESEDTDNVGDASVEINVEELIADFEGTADEVSQRKREIRRRLEEMAEDKSLDDTYAIDFD